MRRTQTLLLAVAVTVTLAAAFSIANSGYERVNENATQDPISSYPTESEKPGDFTHESLPVRGYVTVSVVRDNSEFYRYADHNLITDSGKDFISAQIGSTSAAANGGNYIALSSDSAAPATSDTTLAGEISGNGLDRSQGTYSHTAGTNTFTVTSIFNATGSASNVQKAGLFTAASGGTLVAENTFSSVNLISGDQLTITWTITIG